MGVEVTLRSVFERPTIRELGEEVERGLKNTGKKKEAPGIRRVSREEEHRVSFAQERLWFLNQLEPESGFYNMTAAVRMRGEMNEEALEGAVTEVVRRHEALRTRFKTVNGEPMQEIEEGRRQEIRVIDLRGIEEELREREAGRIANEEAERPFDLAEGPMLRVRVVKLGEGDQVVVMTMHHIVSDGWSMGVLVREVGGLYEWNRRGEESGLEELGIQYVDYAVWQREWMRGEVLEEEIRYWRERLAGAPAVMELPTDRPRPAVQRYVGSSEGMVLSEELTGKLKELSRREGVTLFMTVLAGLQALLSRYSGEEDISVGTPIAGRNRMEVEGLIGFFVNTMVIRSDVRGEASYQELLREVREETLGAYGHQELPFEKLVEEMQPERDLSHTPLFQVMFVMQNAPRETKGVSGVGMEAFGAESRTAQFELTVEMMEVGGRAGGTIQYNTDLFDKSTIERMTGHLERILESIVENPKEEISRLEMMREEEKRQVMEEWNGTRKEYGERRCIHEMFEEEVERSRGAIAVVTEREEVSYDELNRKANQLGRYLRRKGIGAESLVGICVERSIEMVVGILGIMKAGGAYVPLDPTYPKQRLGFMMEDAEVEVLLTEEGLEERIPWEKARIVNLDEEREAIGEESEANLEKVTGVDNLAYVIYTSGSTGQPKGAMNTHRAVANRLLWMQEEYGMSESDRVLQKTPFSFDVSVWEFFWPLLTGATLVMAKPGGHQDSRYLVDVIAGQKITTVHFVPSMLQAFLQEEGLERCTKLKRVISSGEALSYELKERFYERMGGR
jgi:non-ribosomal peptide synthetase component F